MMGAFVAPAVLAIKSDSICAFRSPAFGQLAGCCFASVVVAPFDARSVRFEAVSETIAPSRMLPRTPRSQRMTRAVSGLSLFGEKVIVKNNHATNRPKAIRTIL